MAFAAILQAAAPAVFYTDLDSGPNTGGENKLGAYVTIYGNNFGAVRGESTVTFGGGAVASYKSWSNTKIVVGLGPSAATGPVVVRVDGVESNSNVSFTVRSGRILFVATNGSDSKGNGSATLPWATVSKCVTSMAAGDICYDNGVSVSGVGMYSSTLLLGSSGGAGKPLALVAYPGTQPTIGGDAAQRGLYVSGTYPNYVSYWTVAGFYLHAATSAVQLNNAKYWRLIGNKISCPNGNGSFGCYTGIGSSYITFLGNELTNIGCGSGPTGGLDDGVGGSLQAVQLPCGTGKGPGTVSSSDGITVTADAPRRFAGVSVGDHIIINTGAGAEERIIASDSDSSGGRPDSLTVTQHFNVKSFSGKTWEFRGHMASKLYHVFYPGTNSSNYEIGWNSVHNNSATHGIQIHSTPFDMGITGVSATTPVQITVPRHGLPMGKTAESGIVKVACNAPVNGHRWVTPVDANTLAVYADAGLTKPIAGNGQQCSYGVIIWGGLLVHDISIHDNVIHHQNGAGITLETLDPGSGPIKVYNNLIYHNGTGPQVANLYHWAGIYLGGPDGGSPLYGSGIVEIYHNTLYDNGTFAGAISGSNRTAIDMYEWSVRVRLRNNIIRQATSGETYVAGAQANTLIGDHNLWYGAGAPPPGLSGDINADPKFADVNLPDFHPMAGSPAIGAGGPADSGLTDKDGAPRKNRPTIGAFEASDLSQRPRNSRAGGGH